MKLTILGSGGATLTPRPGCGCKICKQAREEGVPYSRTGPSLFLEDINLLFDTPEEISHQLNRENILEVDYIFYSHWDPDHTLGMRIVEQFGMYWLVAYVDGKGPSKKIKIYALPQVMKDLKEIKNKFGPYFGYYEKKGLISTATLEENKPFKIKDIEIIPVPLKDISGKTSTIFIIQQKDKKIIYAPCDIKPFPKHEESFKDADILIIGGVIPEGKLKDGYIVPEDNELRKELFSFKEFLELIDNLNIKRTIVTHIEEEWGRSFDDYKRIEKENKKHSIEFAYDGMVVEL